MSLFRLEHGTLKEIQREISQALVSCNLIIIHPTQFLQKLLDFARILDSSEENTKKNLVPCSILKKMISAHLWKSFQTLNFFLFSQCSAALRNFKYNTYFAKKERCNNPFLPILPFLFPFPSWFQIFKQSKTEEDHDLLCRVQN